MSLCLYISMGGIAATNKPFQEECFYILRNNDVSTVIQGLRTKFASDVDEGRLFGWQGLQTWLNSHQQVKCCIVIDANTATLSSDAKNCIRKTQAHVSWIATLCLAELVKHREDGWLQEWTWHFPTMSQLEPVDDADNALNRQSVNLDVTDCLVVKQIQSKPLKAWLDKVWGETGELQPELIKLAQVPPRTIPEIEKIRILDELGLYKIGRGNWTPLALLLLSYVRVNHCQGGWLHEARCGPIDSCWSWLRRLANDGYQIAKKAGFWIVLILMLVVGIFVLYSEFASLDSGTPLQLEQLIRLLSGVMLIVAALVMMVKKLRHTLDYKYAARVIFIGILVIFLPILQELFTFLLERPIEIPTLIWFLLSFALAALLLVGVFADEI